MSIDKDENYNRVSACVGRKGARQETQIAIYGFLFLLGTTASFTFSYRSRVFVNI